MISIDPVDNVCHFDSRQDYVYSIKLYVIKSVTSRYLRQLDVFGGNSVSNNKINRHVMIRFKYCFKYH